MAINFDWMRDAYSGVLGGGDENNKGWSVTNDQANPDRGVFKDALQVGTASKYVDYELSKGLLESAADTQTRVMDADRKNTEQLMGTEHNYTTAGMEKANTLSKDYLRAEGQENREVIRTTGEEQRITTDHKRQGDFTLARTGLRR